MNSYLLLALAAFATFAPVLWAGNDSRGPLTEPARAPIRQANSDSCVAAGRALYLKNCAHCHAADAHGDEGPDLHNLDWTDAQIGTRIQNGKKGQMPAFAGKLSAEQIKEITAYLRTLK